MTTQANRSTVQSRSATGCTPPDFFSLGTASELIASLLADAEGQEEFCPVCAAPQCLGTGEAYVFDR